MNNHYEFKKTRRKKDTMRLLRKGWELVSESASGTWFWGRSYHAILRRPSNGAFSNGQMHEGLAKAYNQ